MSTSQIRQEIANSVTHGIAACLSVGALAVMVVFASLRGTVWHVVSCSIYGTTMVLLYTASTLYHAIQTPRAKQILHIIDHSSIYLLIAGTYTPFCLATGLRGGWGWSLFGCIWGLALIGIALKISFTGRFKFLSTLVYLLMGWLVIIAVKPLWGALPRPAFFCLLGGGLMYSLGILFYAWKSLPYSHAIWHVFVFAASACHFVAIMFFIIL